MFSSLLSPHRKSLRKPISAERVASSHGLPDVSELRSHGLPGSAIDRQIVGQLCEQSNSLPHVFAWQQSDQTVQRLQDSLNVTELQRVGRRLDQPLDVRIQPDAVLLVTLAYRCSLSMNLAEGSPSLLSMRQCFYELEIACGCLPD